MEDLTQASTAIGYLKSFNTVLQSILVLMVTVGVVVAMAYYLPLRFLPIDGAYNMVAALVGFGFIGLLLIGLLALPFPVAAWILRRILGHHIELLHNDTRHARSNVLLIPPVVSAGLFGITAFTAHWWPNRTIAIYISATICLNLVAWWPIRRSRMERIPESAAGIPRSVVFRLIGFWLLWAIFPILPFLFILGAGLPQAWWQWALYFGVMVTVGGWIASMLALPARSWGQAAFTWVAFLGGVLPITANIVLGGGFFTMIVNRSVSDIGVRIDHATLILDQMAYREVQSRCGGRGMECEHLPRQIRDTTDYCARDVRVFSDIGSRWLVGFQSRGASAANVDSTPAAAKTAIYSRYMDVVLRSDSIRVPSPGGTPGTSCPPLVKAKPKAAGQLPSGAHRNS